MAVTATMKSDTLRVPGASLYYEVRGAGPVLLMMPGGPGDATTFRRIEDALAQRYTVVTYDPRTYSRSTLDEPVDDARMVEVFADDVHRLLAHLGDERAHVFASSGGAVIALELARVHGDQLGTVVAHEPPSPALVADSDRVRAAMEEVCDTCAAEGIWPAMQKFMILVGVEGGGPPPEQEGEPTQEQLEAQGLMHKNMQYFFGRYIRNIARYTPDIDALKACSCRVVPAVAVESKGQLAHDGAVGLAKLLGTDAVVFPGGHGGFDERPLEFATKLREVLQG